MIGMRGIGLPPGHDRDALIKKTARAAGCRPDEIRDLVILRRSVDARKKPELRLEYTVAFQAPRDKQKRILQKAGAFTYEPVRYRLPESGAEQLPHRPVVIGLGPAGLFAGLMLARAGYRPLILERGRSMEERAADVERYWETMRPDPDSNVLFGEGGAGTFSDGKLATGIKDPDGRIGEVMDSFIRAGAPDEIRWDQHPHLGTDRLRDVIPALRREIERLGGDVRFGARVVRLQLQTAADDICLTGLLLASGETVPCEAAILAIGHSARDTVRALYGQGVPMEAKAFAVGLRAAHPQRQINEAQYGSPDPPFVGPAPYKLTAQAPNGRRVFSFCMCPGGRIVAASSGPGQSVVNGMSYSGRAGAWANSALIVSVSPEDYPGTGPLSGIAFQEELEKKAYEAGRGAIPVCTWQEFRNHTLFDDTRIPADAFCGKTEHAQLRGLLPEPAEQGLIDVFASFGRRIKGFDDHQTILAGVESRTSSPVRILRDAGGESRIRGLYPCGEGAGYAGGITSAAVDGIRIAEAVIRRFSPAPGAKEEAEE